MDDVKSAYLQCMRACEVEPIIQAEIRIQIAAGPNDTLQDLLDQSIKRELAAQYAMEQTATRVGERKIRFWKRYHNATKQNEEGSAKNK